MVAIPFPVTTTPGFRAQESAGRLINCYAEPIGPGSKDNPPPSKRIRVPGMTTFLTSSLHGFRGMQVMAGILYISFKNTLVTGTAAGGPVFTNNFLSGEAPVYFAANFKNPPDKLVLTEDDVFLINAPGDIIEYPDSSLPRPNGMCQLGGYFVFTIADGRIFASDLNDTPVDDLSLGTANVQPDRPVRPIPFSGRLLIFGERTLEFWIDVGSTPFPFQRTTTVPFGLIGPDAVSGWEDGWGAGLLWVANDHTVRMLDGYTPVRVSVPDLERLIQRDNQKQKLMASVYVSDGHPVWSITGETFTWSYDLSTQRWHERASYLTNRWRGLQTTFAFGRWLVGDRGRPNLDADIGGYLDDSNIYQIDPLNHREAGELLPIRVESGPVINFPQRVRVGRADFHLDIGVGIAAGEDPIQIDPTVMISWSDDGGLNWSIPVHQRMGRQSDYKNISVYRTGMTTRLGRRWRLDISDPIYIAIIEGDQSIEMRYGSVPGGQQ